MVGLLIESLRVEAAPSAEWALGPIDGGVNQMQSQAPQLDAEADGVPDASDNCPAWPNPSQSDVDANGTGDDCECGDQNGDGTVNVSDIVAINRAIFRSEPASALCDANGDGLCNVSDMLAVNREIYSPGSTSTCGRRPVPGP